MKRTLTCPGCGKKATAKETGGNIGKIHKQTGYEPLSTHRGEFVYLCPDCYDIVHEHALVIAEIVKNEYVYFPRLLNEPKHLNNPG